MRRILNLPAWAKVLIALALGILAGMVIDNIVMFVGTTALALVVLFQGGKGSSE